MRLLFIGTGDIGLPSLEWLIATTQHELVGVVTQPDKPAGRRLVLTPPQIKVRAQAAGLTVLQPPKIRHAVEELRALGADAAIVAAYGQLLSPEVLRVPRLGCLNLHASLLPRHRGASPIQAAIREGDVETGMTVMYMDEGLDTGDILLMERTPVLADDTGGRLHDRLAALAPVALERALELLEAGTAPRVPQDSVLATHCGKLRREDGRLDWSRSAVELERLVRAYHPWPGTFTRLEGGALLKIHRVSVLPVTGATVAPGEVLAADAKSGLLVQCGDGWLRVEEVQAEGGRRLPAAEFLRGHPVSARLV
jgi:methionyl-tRNA formyltransferase